MVLPSDEDTSRNRAREDIGMLSTPLDERPLPGLRRRKLSKIFRILGFSCPHHQSTHTSGDKLTSFREDSTTEYFMGLPDRDDSIVEDWLEGELNSSQNARNFVSSSSNGRNSSTACIVPIS